MLYDLVAYKRQLIKIFLRPVREAILNVRSQNAASFSKSHLKFIYFAVFCNIRLQVFHLFDGMVQHTYNHSGWQFSYIPLV
jgi:hypothetical protein